MTQTTRPVRSNAHEPILFFIYKYIFFYALMDSTYWVWSKKNTSVLFSPFSKQFFWEKNTERLICIKAFFKHLALFLFCTWWLWRISLFFNQESFQKYITNMCTYDIVWVFSIITRHICLWINKCLYLCVFVRGISSVNRILKFRGIRNTKNIGDQWGHLKRR